MSDRIEFTKEMKKTYTVLVPMMLPIHFQMLENILSSEGYHVEVLETTGRQIVDEGLKNVHNDTCYPALLVIGQFIDALKSGKYDVNKTALALTQTGGGCRASNYIYLLRKALKQAGFPQVPVISLNFSNLEKNSGFSLTPKLLIKMLFALIYGDMIMWVSNQCLPYEVHKGDTERVIRKWTSTLNQQFHSPKFLSVRKNYRAILDDFAAIPRNKTKKIRVGIVGEIYMKYSPLGNNNLEKFLIGEGAEPVVSGVLDFGLYCVQNAITDFELYGRNKRMQPLIRLAKKYLQSCQNCMIKAIDKHGEFVVPSRFEKVKEAGSDFIGKGAKMGEGWLLTSEMVDLLKTGVNSIVCTQPFGCLPNHIVAKGMVHKIKEAYPMANVVAVDYDPSATEINQENRLKLMLSNARLTEAFANGGKVMTFSPKTQGKARNVKKVRVN